MTEPDPKKQPTRRAQGWLLAIVLSLILVAGWAMFLAVAPTPVPVAQKPVETVTPPPPPANQLRFLAWRNAVDTDVLATFAAESGIKVIVDGYDTNEQLNALAAAGAIDHDVAFVSGIGLKALTEKNLLQPLAKDMLSNARNLDPALMARAALYDPHNTHSVVVMWGTIGIGYNAVEVAKRLDADTPIDSWAVLFDPVNAARLADCGIQVMDSPTGVFPVTLTYLGLPADSAKPEDTDAATRLWENIRPSIASFSSLDIIDNLAAGKTCLALATSGDAYQARSRARAAGLPSDIRYMLPKEGTVVWYDLMVIPKAAVNSANALRFIDYLLRPEVAARLTNAKGYGNAVTGAALYVKPEIKIDAALSPDLAKLPKLVEETAPPAAAADLRKRFWQLINAGPDAPK